MFRERPQDTRCIVPLNQISVIRREKNPNPRVTDQATAMYTPPYHPDVVGISNHETHYFYYDQQKLSTASHLNLIKKIQANISNLRFQSEFQPLVMAYLCGLDDLFAQMRNSSYLVDDLKSSVIGHENTHLVQELRMKLQSLYFQARQITPEMFPANVSGAQKYERLGNVLDQLAILFEAQSYSLGLVAESCVHIHFSIWQRLLFMMYSAIYALSDSDEFLQHPLPYDLTMLTILLQDVTFGSAEATQTNTRALKSQIAQKLSNYLSDSAQLRADVLDSDFQLQLDQEIFRLTTELQDILMYVRNRQKILRQVSRVK